MGCKSCGGKKRNYSVTRASNVSKRPDGVRKVNKSLNSKVLDESGKVSESSTPARCPVCQSALKKVSRMTFKDHVRSKREQPVNGELLQCMNAKCGYLRKVR